MVIGGGPIGLFTVFMCGMSQLKCSVLEALPVLGGQCQTLYPEKPIYDIPGFPQIKAQELINGLAVQMAPFAPNIFLEERAEHLSSTKDGLWQIVSSKGRVFIAPVVVICCGGGAFTPKKPPLDSIEEFEGKSIFYSISSLDVFSDKRIVIAGGGDSAIDWALLLGKTAKEVHIIHRRTQFRAHESTLADLLLFQKEGKVTIHAPFQLASLGSTDGVLSHVIIKDFSDQTKTIETDYLLPFFGMTANLDHLTNWGLDIEKGCIKTDPLTGQTNRSGIYAAGDIATYPNKLKLILTGFAEVAQIAHHIKSYLFPDQHHSFQHSTTKGIPSIS